MMLLLASIFSASSFRGDGEERQTTAEQRGDAPEHYTHSSPCELSSFQMCLKSGGTRLDLGVNTDMPFCIPRLLFLQSCVALLSALCSLLSALGSHRLVFVGPTLRVRAPECEEEQQRPPLALLPREIRVAAAIIAVPPCCSSIVCFRLIIINRRQQQQRIVTPATRLR